MTGQDINKIDQVHAKELVTVVGDIAEIKAGLGIP